MPTPFLLYEYSAATHVLCALKTGKASAWERMFRSNVRRRLQMKEYLPHQRFEHLWRRLYVATRQMPLRKMDELESLFMAWLRKTHAQK